MKPCIRLLMVIVLAAFSFSTYESSVYASQAGTPEAISRAISFYPESTGPGTFVTVNAAPGETQEFTIVMGNSGTIEQRLRTYAIPALTADNGGLMIAPHGSELDEITGWLDYSEQEYTLEPGVGQQINVKVTVPKDARPGEYVTAIAAEQAEAFEVDGTDLIGQRVRSSIAILVVVPGELVRDFEFDAPHLELRDGLLIARFQISNTGNAIIQPSGEIRLLDEDGNVVGVTDVSLGSVYTGTTATINVAWEGSFTDEMYSLEIELEDPSSGATSSQMFGDLVPAASSDVVASATPAPELAFASAMLEPLTDDVPPSMLSFTGSISNPGDSIENARVSIVTYQDEIEVDRYPILQGVTLETGSTDLESRYSLPGGFTEGTYTFEVTIEVGGNDSQTVLLTHPIEFEVVAP